jgi:hypothetical protein
MCKCLWNIAEEKLGFRFVVLGNEADIVHELRDSSEYPSCFFQSTHTDQGGHEPERAWEKDTPAALQSIYSGGVLISGYEAIHCQVLPNGLDRGDHPLVCGGEGRRRVVSREGWRQNLWVRTTV